MPHLGELYVSNARNSLSVSGKPFSHLNLYILDLKSNNIVNLSSNVFVGLNNISILDVSYNNLETPDFHWFEGKLHQYQINQVIYKHYLAVILMIFTISHSRS